MKISLTGKSNTGLGRKRAEKFEVIKIDNSIQVKDSAGKILISFTPFLNGGSVWLSDFSDIIMDVEHWDEDKEGKYKMIREQKQAISNVSSNQILRWKQDSEKLAKLREAQKILEDVKE